MGRFDTTKATINANIKSNGNQEITGSVLNSVLQEMVDGTDAQLTELSAEIFGGEELKFSSTIAANSGLGDKIFQVLEKGKTYLFRSDVACNLEYYTNDGGYLHLFDAQTEVLFVCPSNYKEGENQIVINTEPKEGKFQFFKVTGGKLNALSAEIEGVSEDVTELSNKVEDFSTELDATSKKAGKYEESSEYVQAFLDKEGKFLFGIKIDGSIEWAKGVPTPIKVYIETAIKDSEPKILKMLSLQPAEKYNMYHEVVLDAEEHLLTWRDRKGVKHESNMRVENNLELSKSAMSNFIQSLIASGFTTDNPIDHSNETAIALPLPRYCAVVNIISPLGLATSKTQDVQCELEYLDKSGNYFKKPIILNAQGTSSMSYIEKNQSIDIFNDEAREESCEITFDNWVAQDSFHLKCYYIDVFRGVCNMAYKWTEEVIKATDSRNNRVKWNRDDITEYNSTGDFAADFSDSALCHPDGFPFEMYLNGEYYGLYAWNIKKHRKNYSMKKSNYKELLLDGLIDNTTFFNGSINWSEIELRNPKTLITMSGAEYDGENPTELIDSSSSAYNSANKDHVNTAITKAAMQRISNALPLIRSASDEQAKALFESHFDVKALMRYFIISNTLHHYDGFAKNWIWTIYDGIAAPTEYDMDSIFGRDYRGLLVVSNSTTKILGTEVDTITGQLIRLYKNEMDAMYKELRDKGILSVENIMRYVLSWCESATYAALERNLEKWTSIPSYRASRNMNDGSQEGGMYDSPYRIEKWLSERIGNLDIYFNY